jgi:glycosyltransferase involved in cell wall biosynthesis
MVAFHFPPHSGSSGLQRTLRFVQHLPYFGWQPLVLSAHPMAYENKSDDLLDEIPATTIVRRAFALDAARHLQYKGRYFDWMAQPDRWASWKYHAIWAGMKLIKRYQPDAIWSSYPIASAHLIASALHQKSGIPWVADFRDPMAHEGYPVDPHKWQIYRGVETDAAARAKRCIFTTPSALKYYKDRYPVAASRMVMIENGYDEESFSALPRVGMSLLAPSKKAQKIVLLHSGIIYPTERDPRQFFSALGQLRRSGLIAPETLCIRFRAAIHDALLRHLAQVNGVQDMIELCPPIPYRDALAEMLDVDALLIMQGRDCNAQIPAKIYEYIRAGKPILGLTDHQGDTACVLQQAGLSAIASLDSMSEIASVLMQFISTLNVGSASLPKPDYVASASRRNRSEILANVLNQLA